ncbi:MAG: hypothetical protein WBP64_21600 [Nitrososphaeraceae archaeon]
MIKNIIMGASIVLLSAALGFSMLARSEFSIGPTAFAQTITPKMHLDEGINALKNGDNQGAMMHLEAADQGLASSSSSSDQSAKMHLDQGLSALKNGDNQGAMMHLEAADQALGSTSK